MNTKWQKIPRETPPVPSSSDSNLAPIDPTQPVNSIVKDALKDYDVVETRVNGVPSCMSLVGKIRYAR